MSLTGLFSIGVSGVTAFTTSLEAVSNNIANSQTVGFKRARTDFADLVTAGAQQPGGRGGAGVGAVNRQLIAEQGAVTRTQTKTNAAISGDGFFVVSETANGNGGVAPYLFTRAGDFAPNAAGDLVNGAHYFLQGYALNADGGANGARGLSGLETVNINRRPPLPDGAADPGALLGVEIAADGRLMASYANGETYALYRIPVALFTNSGGLDEASATAFLNATDAGSIQIVNPGESRSGILETAAVEISTVDIGSEFSTLIATQRAYASNAKIISVADELWRKLVETAA
ncbi:MAG: flagellar hook basal-body protein [Pseudomonadota bacterium]|nr:flagellar hook basal-body protein [Pseudomonadota bacterium]